MTTISDARAAQIDRERWRRHDGCEWNPDTGQLAYDTDPHFRSTRAAVIVGRTKVFRLCAACADLPHFKRYRARRTVQKVEVRRG